MNNSENEYGKSPRGGSRSLYVTLLAILMSVAVIVAVAGSVAKNVKKADTKLSAITTGKKEAKETQGDAQNTEPGFKEGSETDGETLPDTEKETEPEVTTAEDTKDAAAPADVLPVFSAPCDGEVMRGYTGETPVFSVTMEDWRTHSGIDVYSSAGSPVKCVADGVVSDIWDDAMMGSCISVAHSGGAVSVYKNLSDDIPQWIEKGIAVKAGDTIASVGESALEEIADESHLHFELKVNGVSVNPEEYITFPNVRSYEE